MQNWPAESDGSAQVAADAFVLHVPASDTGLWSTYTTLDDVRARLKILAERKKRREQAGFVNAAGRQLAETLMRTWPVPPLPTMSPQIPGKSEKALPVQ